MNRVYLVRHALTRIDPTRPGHTWDLDPAGADLLAELVALPCWAGAYRICCSTEPKAIKTAEAIAHAHGLGQPEPFAALREVDKQGYIADHDRVMEQLFRNPDRPAADGWETAASALSRFRGAIDRLVGEAAGRDMIVVAHATVLSLYLASLQGQDRVDPADWRAVGFPDVAVVDTATMRLVQPFGAWRAATPT